MGWLHQIRAKSCFILAMYAVSESKIEKLITYEELFHWLSFLQVWVCLLVHQILESEVTLDLVHGSFENIVSITCMPTRAVNLISSSSVSFWDGSFPRAALVAPLAPSPACCRASRPSSKCTCPTNGTLSVMRSRVKTIPTWPHTEPFQVSVSSFKSDIDIPNRIWRESHNFLSKATKEPRMPSKIYCWVSVFWQEQRYATIDCHMKKTSETCTDLCRKETKC